MTICNLERMFAPETIAVVGASESSGSIGAAVMQNLVDGGVKGTIFPVNLKYQRIWNRNVYPSISKIPAPVDLVIITSPIHTVPAILRSCIEQGAGGAVVISAGGKEIGEEGAAIESEIEKTIAGTDFRVIGPNSLGLMSVKNRLNSSFARHELLRGRMAFISQSGAICTAILDFAAKMRLGFSHFVHLGSMVDVDFGDIIDYLGGDPEVDSILMYVENLSHIRKFMSAARAVSRIKPIIALKAGRTRAGAIAAASHTGAMAGEDAIYDAAFKRAGVIRVKTFAELFDCAAFLQNKPRTPGNGLAVVTNAGGPGVMAADALSDYGIEPLTLSEQTIRELDAILPPFWSQRNPVDILGDASPERYRLVIDVLMDAPEVDGMLIMLAPQALTESTKTAEMIAAQISHHRFPVFASWLGGIEVDKGRDILNEAGIPTFDSPERAVRAFMNLFKYSRNIEMLQQIPSNLPRQLKFDRKTAESVIRKGLRRPNGVLSETESKLLLAAYGIRVNLPRVAEDTEKAVYVADRLGYPVVLKLHSTRITHKSDAGGVVLNLMDSRSVRAAFKDIREKSEALGPEIFEGVSVQKMLARPEYELIAGARHEPDFGPVIIFGLGGTLTEILCDRSIALPPLNRILARRMMEETRIFRVIEGYRSYKPLDITGLEELLIRLSHLVTDFAEIGEIDINPLLATADAKVVAADARVIIRPSPVVSPSHLVISPYPKQYEEQFEIEGGPWILMRPIRPEDAPLLTEMFDSLSETTIYFRFFGPMRRLPHRMLARFTQIDYDREIAMVAILRENDKEQMIGVGRVIMECNRKSAEFAILVADSFHGKGIGAKLLKRCLEIAKTWNIDSIWGAVLPGNTKMLALGRKLGFTVTQRPDEYELVLDLKGQKQLSDHQRDLIQQS